MEIVFFAHSPLLESQSMPRFANMLVEGMRKRGWGVKIFMPRAYFSRLPAPRVLRKWLGYVDQYLLFPFEVKAKIKDCHPGTLFVFTDHALGPWIPLVADKAHVIHCHDFLAQKSAIGAVKENPTGFTGRIYQSYIHRGYCSGKHFISVSKNTRRDLESFLDGPPAHSKVVYNGMNQVFNPSEALMARVKMSDYTGLDLSAGYVLHVGGNQWYKNRVGVIEIYNEWRLRARNPLPLVMVGKTPDKKLNDVYEKSPFKSDIHLVVNLPDNYLSSAYAGARVLLFPSIAEGFGWPIAEAMACGCPVITTDAAPMTEVAGKAAFLIPIQPHTKTARKAWASKGANTLDNILEKPSALRSKIIEAGLLNAKRFDSEKALDRIESIYLDVLSVYAGRGDLDKTLMLNDKDRNEIK